MAEKQHTYRVNVVWTGNEGSGTANYRAYSRNHEINAAGKPPVLGSADPSFRGGSGALEPRRTVAGFTQRLP